MLPLLNIAHVPVNTPSLVNTAIPENIAQRVPYDNVAPPVSSPRTEPDAKNNPQFFSLPLSTSTPNTSVTSAQTIEGRPLSGAPIGTPATLIAQFISQPVPQQTSQQLRSLLDQYEKQIASNQTKEAPANIVRIDAGPAGAFSKLLGQPVKSPGKNSDNTPRHVSDIDVAEESDSIATELPAMVPPVALRSYQASLTRNDTLKSVSEQN